MGCVPPGRRSCPALWAKHVVLSHRFVTHTAADGGCWTGLYGCCDHSYIPLLLSGVVCEAVIFEKWVEWRGGWVRVMKNSWRWGESKGVWVEVVLGSAEHTQRWKAWLTLYLQVAWGMLSQEKSRTSDGCPSHTQSGGWASMLLPLASSHGCACELRIETHSGKPKCVHICLFSFPPSCLDGRWTLSGEDALLLGQVFWQLLRCPHRGPVWLPSREHVGLQLSPFPTGSPSWIQDGGYPCEVPQKEKTQEFWVFPATGPVLCNELETPDVQCDIDQRLQICESWLGLPLSDAWGSAPPDTARESLQPPI